MTGAAAGEAKDKVKHAKTADGVEQEPEHDDIADEGELDADEHLPASSPIHFGRFNDFARDAFETGQKENHGKAGIVPEVDEDNREHGGDAQPEDGFNTKDADDAVECSHLLRSKH